MEKSQVLEIIADIRKQIIESPSSIFSKEDVSRLCTSLKEQVEEVPEIVLPPVDVEELSEYVTEKLENNLHRVVDHDQCSFCIGMNNQVELEDLVIHGPKLLDYIQSAIDDYMESLWRNRTAE